MRAQVSGMSSRTSGLWRAARVGLAVAVVTLAGSSAMAQPGGGGGGGGRGQGGPGGGMRGMMGDMFSSPVATREVDLFASVAGLTSEQKDNAKTLLEGYQAQFRTKSDKMQKEMDKVRAKFEESRDPAVWTEMRGSMATFRTERAAIEEQFFTDFKALLTPEQVERWPLIERAHRRSRTMSRGMMSGERVDLVQIMESSKFPVEVQASVLPVISEYEEALDRELIIRNKAYDEVAAAFQQANPGDGFAKAQDLMQKGREASMHVRDLNKKYARMISDLLPAESKPAFESAVKQASYPDVYRPSLTNQQLTAAEQFTDLDASQKESLASLKESYSRSLAAVNEKLETAITDREEKWDPRQMGRGGRGGPGGNGGGGGNRGQGGRGNNNNNDNDPVGDLRKERRTLDETTAASLKKILSETQFQRLPDEEEGGDRRGGRGGQRRGNTDQQI